MIVTLFIAMFKKTAIIACLCANTIWLIKFKDMMLKDVVEERHARDRDFDNKYS